MGTIGLVYAPMSTTSDYNAVVIDLHGREDVMRTFDFRADGMAL